MRLLWSRPPPGRSRNRGQSLVEFALVFPILLLLFAAAADLGRIFYNFVALENAVKEGALYGSRNPLCDDASSVCPDPNNVRWRVENEARIGATALATPTSECRNAVSGVAYADLRDCVAGDLYVVDASITFELLTPILGQLIGGGLTLEAESTAVVLNQAFELTPGLAPTKLVLATSATNALELLANCEQPDPVGSPDYVRAPCEDVVAPMGPDPDDRELFPVFRPGDNILYKIVVINNGATDVTAVTMSDPLAGPSCPPPPTIMYTGGVPYMCDYGRTAPAVSGPDDEMPYTNALTVDGAEILPSVDDATVIIERPPADLQVSKFVGRYLRGGIGDGPAFGTDDELTLFTNAAVPSPSAWFKIVVHNVGGRPATGLVVVDSNGSLPTGTTNCPVLPSSLAPGDFWICRYEESYTGPETSDNAVTATSPDATPDTDDSDSATVTVEDCAGSDLVIPRLVDLDRAPGETLWAAAGFLPANLSSYPGTGPTLTQNVGAFSCVADDTSMTITD